MGKLVIGGKRGTSRESRILPYFTYDYNLAKLREQQPYYHWLVNTADVTLNYIKMKLNLLQILAKS